MHKELKFGNVWNFSAAAIACVYLPRAHMPTDTHITASAYATIGIARVHAFQFCRNSRWIIAAPKCLICSPGHGQISEPTNLIELSIPAGKGYRVATRTAQAEWKGQQLSPFCNGLTRGILLCFVFFFLSFFLSIFFKSFSQPLDCKIWLA